MVPISMTFSDLDAYLAVWNILHSWKYY